MLSWLVIALSGFVPHAKVPDGTMPPSRRLGTIPSARVGGAPDLPLSDPRLRPQAGRTVEQVHVTAGADGTTVHVTWSANGSSAASPSRLLYAGPFEQHAWVVAEGPPGEVYSTLLDPRYPKTEAGGCEGGANYTNPSCYYTSPTMHSVTLTGLRPSSRYTFRCADDTHNFTLTTLPAAAAASHVRLGVVGDLGQTENSTATIDALYKHAASGAIDAVLHAGDLSYADGDGNRWDSYGRLMEPLSTLVPLAHTGGNHEFSSGGENWVAYKARYPNSHLSAGSTSFLWYSFEAGPAHFVMLCSYADTRPGSAQYEWLRRDLGRVERQSTPWLVVVVHTPFYTSNAHHPMAEGSAMRLHFEPLMLAAGVDLVFNGHVHAYERSLPVADLKVDDVRGIPHITIGDGGNREHFATPWAVEQPPWSAVREYAYGWGLLELNATEATWTWMRNNDPWNPPPAGLVGDRAVYRQRLARRGSAA